MLGDAADSHAAKLIALEQCSKNGFIALCKSWEDRNRRREEQNVCGYRDTQRVEIAWLLFLIKLTIIGNAVHM